jgi:ribosome maturation factor RimP
MTKSEMIPRIVSVESEDGTVTVDDSTWVSTIVSDCVEVCQHIISKPTVLRHPSGTD